MAMEINEQIERYEKESLLLNLPTELLTYIIEQSYREDILNWNDIFKEPKINLGKMQGLAATSKAWRDLYIKTFNDLKIIKIQRFQKLKEQIKEEYNSLNQEQLDHKLSTILAMNSNISEEELKLATRLIIAGANINIRNKYGTTALMYSSEKGCKEIVKILMKLYPNVNAKDNHGCTALMKAVQKGHKEIIEMLIDKDADINAKDNDGYTALIQASKTDCRNIVEFLIKADANINVKDNNGWTALMWASHKGYKHIVKMLIKAYANVNATNNNGDTALMITTYKEIAEILIAAGTDVNIKNRSGETALMSAFRFKNKEIVELLNKVCANNKNSLKASKVNNKDNFLNCSLC